MSLYLVPGINGLGNTAGAVLGGEKLLKGRNYEKVEVNNYNISEQLEQIYDFSKKSFSKNLEGGMVFVGGDHSISYPLVKGFVEKFKDNAKLIVFDAHADLMEPMQEPTHEEWLRAVIEKTGLPGERIMLIGLREVAVEHEEGRYLEEQEISRADIGEDIRSKIKKFIKGDGEVYVSFDIDVFDKSLVENGTGYAVEDGFGEKEGLELVRFLSQNLKVKYWDLVEVASNGENNKAVDLGRKVLSSILI